MAMIWAVLMIALVIVETATVNLISIWFALGGLAAMIVSLLGAAVWIQIAVFLIVSCAVLLLLRPATRKLLGGRIKATNADRVIGMKCYVTEEIDNLRSTGAVSVDGKSWTARSEDGSVIEAGEMVMPVRIEGVKLIVSRAEERKTVNKS